MPADLRAAYQAHLRATGEGGAAFSPAGLEYLFHLIYRASYQGKGFRDLPAAELCRAFRAQAESDFGSFAEDAMRRFRMETYGDLGRAVFLLAGHGCLSLKPEETLEAYESLGRIRFFAEASGGRND
jgi:uncharacterized repeat protein (TIGR04138 family)